MWTCDSGFSKEAPETHTWGGGGAADAAGTGAGRWHRQYGAGPEEPVRGKPHGGFGTGLEGEFPTPPLAREPGQPSHGLRLPSTVYSSCTVTRDPCRGPGARGKYAIRVVTRDSLLAGSRNLVQLWLVGEQGEADLGKKLWPVRSETEFEVSVPVHLGRLLLAKRRKILLDDAWLCERVCARPRDPGRGPLPLLPPGAGLPGRLPARGHRRRRGDRRKGGAGADRVQGGLCSCRPPTRTLSDDHQDFLKAQREQELQERKKVYRWGSRKDGPILPVAGRTQCDLPRNQRFLEDKDFDFRVSPAKAPAPGAGGLGLEGSLDLTHPVKIAEDFKRASRRAGTPLAGFRTDVFRAGSKFREGGRLLRVPAPQGRKPHAPEAAPASQRGCWCLRGRKSPNPGFLRGRGVSCSLQGPGTAESGWISV
ncbi:polyunsaturated fatty acid (12S)/(13S)-lipoxygenase, epidermal-type-like [Lynx rufus]|uniref:polyunsaturated fatty acid (12S)/(13S)-lipoxygenase, epidermal-type-like n=1 Tax=Lynx rufus TaxID=61384 RepID=UPI001F12861F|nr:polyunsaturated fatty acid (12S)/(13S)-lipoxygenase, epidermal-type-like [Lynx rufus]